MKKEGLHIRDEGNGPPVVFLHGWSCPGSFFDDQVRGLKGEMRCIVPDLPGHGATSEKLVLTIEASADAVYSYLTDEDLSRVVLCGWSMGALVAFSLMQRHGTDRIASMIAIDMTPKVLNDPDWRNGTLNGLDADQNAHVLENLEADWSHLPGRIARRLFASSSYREIDILAWVKAEIQKQDPALLKPMWASLTAQDFREFLIDCDLPVHLVAGLKSQLYGSELHKWYQNTVPDFTLHAFDNSGHAPHLEEPEKFSALLREIVPI